MPGTFRLLLILPLLLQGCGERNHDPQGNTDTAIQRELDTRLEVMHQTREVLQYTIEQQALEQQRLKALDSNPAK